MIIDNIDESTIINIKYKDYMELKEALKQTTQWLWKLRNKETLTSEEQEELIDFMWKYLKCL